jgi:uncharacterized membrane protein (DUF373 family)
VRAIDIYRLESGIGGAETAIYLVAGVLLVVAGVFTVVGTVIDLIEGSSARAVADTGLFLLDRVLLLFIVAELLYTLRVVNFGGQILVEPFLFIGLIAVVRKVLVFTAEADAAQLEGSGFIVTIGGLSGLAFVLAVAIYLLRRSAGAPSPRA